MPHSMFGTRGEVRFRNSNLGPVKGGAKERAKEYRRRADELAAEGRRLREERDKARLALEQERSLGPLARLKRAVSRVFRRS